MSKKTKTNASPKSFKSVVLSVIPVFCALVLIFVVSLVVILVTNSNDKKPTFEGADEIYFEHEDLKVSKNDLYTNMKIEYGAAELIRLIDLKLYAKDIEASKTEEKEAELLKFVLESLFDIEKVEDLEQNEDNQKAWDDLINSLKMNNLISDEEIGSGDDATKVTNLSSKVWTVVKDYYRLQFVRTTWAKDAYVEQWKNEKLAENAEKEVENPEELFTEKEIKAKYEELYEAKTYALFIPFTSEAHAKAMMDKYGINTQSSTSINQNGWISSKYDYNSNASKNEYKLSNEEVLTAFYQMYNEVLGYYNGGKDIINVETDVDKTVNHSAVFNKAVDLLEDALDDYVLYNTATLPANFNVVKGESLKGSKEEVKNVQIVWELVENEYVQLENNTLSVKGTETGTKGTFELKATLTLTVSDDEKYTKTLEFDCQSEVAESGKSSDVKVSEITAESKFTLTTEFMDSFESDTEANKHSKFVWTSKELTAIDSKLNSNLKFDGSLAPINGNDKHEEFYKSYTVAPVSGSNFYFLMVKFAEVEAPSLESVKEEVEKALLDDLRTDNNASDMIYEKRYNAELKIYDKYLEAIYDYDYTYFYETTLKLTDYNKFEESKKNKKDIVASFKVDGQEVTITAEELYKSLEEKYGVSIIIDYLNAYLTVGNDEFNKFYNPYTGKVTDKKALNELLKGEISSFRNNFELDYFTYSYLSYYGFIPNFPASYGWNDFRTDYFGANSDRDLLVSPAFGGYVYNEALEALKEKVYVNALANEGETYDELLERLVKDEIKKIKDEHYSLNVLNLIVSIDTNYDGTYEDPLLEEDCLWTEEQKQEAVKLAKLMYEKAPETLKATLSDQMTQIVLEYKNADFDDETWGEFKKLGLVAKFETVQTYTNTSSLVQEFLDELQKVWNKINEAGMVGEALDAPLLSEAPFPSSYGYHHIAVTGSTKVSELPEEEAQLAIYKALLKYNEVKDSTYEFVKAEQEATKEALEELLEKYGYNLELSKKEELTDEEKEILAESKADFLEKYGFDVDALEFNEETTKLLGTYYDAAVTEVESGDEMTNYTIAFLKGKAFGFKENNEERNEQLQIIVEVTEKELAEEGENE